MGPSGAGRHRPGRPVPGPAQSESGHQWIHRPWGCTSASRRAARRPGPKSTSTRAVAPLTVWSPGAGGTGRAGHLVGELGEEPRDRPLPGHALDGWPPAGAGARGAGRRRPSSGRRRGERPPGQPRRRAGRSSHHVAPRPPGRGPAWPGPGPARPAGGRTARGGPATGRPGASSDWSSVIRIDGMAVDPGAMGDGGKRQVGQLAGPQLGLEVDGGAGVPGVHDARRGRRVAVGVAVEEEVEAGRGTQVDQRQRSVLRLGHGGEGRAGARCSGRPRWSGSNGWPARPPAGRDGAAEGGEVAERILAAPPDVAHRCGARHWATVG